MKQLSPFNKSCLPLINNLRHDVSHPISQQFGDNFIHTAYEGDRPEVTNELGILYLRYQSNEGRVASFRERSINIKL